MAARLAQQHAKLLAEDERARLRAMLLTLEAGALVDNDDQAPQLTQEPTYAIGAALAEALDAGLDRAAVAACELLGERRDASALYSTEGRLSPLVAGLEAASADVRWAALSAILAIAPEAPFAGSSRVADTLAFFATSRGDRVAVVAMPSLERSATVAGYLAAAGYAAVPVTRGDATVIEAAASPDVQLVLLDLAVIEPGVRETLFRLRRTTPSAAIPVALTTEEGRLAQAEAIVAEVELELGRDRARVIATPRVNTPEATASLAGELRALGAFAGSPDEADAARLARADEARKAIVRLLESGPGFYGLGARRRQLVALVATPDEAGLKALATLGTPDSQARLVDDASRSSLPLATRKAAGEAFRASVDRHGLLLTNAEVLRQYDRYNASATADADTQGVLGALLDAIETRRPPTSLRR
jgi:hypothetical protein